MVGELAENVFLESKHSNMKTLSRVFFLGTKRVGEQKNRCFSWLTEKTRMQQPDDEKAAETEWAKLLRRYYIACEQTEGCGEGGSSLVAKEHQKLVAFCEKHPNFKKHLPKCHAHELNPTSGGMAALGSSCNQQ